MPKQEAPLSALQSYLPDNTLQPVLHYLHHYKVHLTVTRERKSILGDYRHKTHTSNHRISVNGNLNKYAFLITLLHELAHLLTFDNYGHRVAAHGKEWKNIYGQLLKQFVIGKIFPADIEMELLHSLKNPAASSCAEDDLIRVLRKYDNKKTSFCLLEELPEGSSFKISDGRIFIKGEKLRKRYKCAEPATKRVFLFSPVYEVQSIS